MTLLRNAWIEKDRQISLDPGTESHRGASFIANCLSFGLFYRLEAPVRMLQFRGYPLFNLRLKLNRCRHHP